MSRTIQETSQAPSLTGAELLPMAVPDGNGGWLSGTMALSRVAEVLLKAAGSGASAVARSVVDWFSDRRNVLGYGADRTGVTDSSAAFNAAIEDLPASGGCVVVPAGTYLCQDVVLRNRVQLVGDGETGNTLLRLPDNATGSAILVSDRWYDGNPSLGRPVVIRDLNLDGNRANQTVAKHGAILDNYQLTVENVKVRNCSGSGILQPQTYRNGSAITFGGAVQPQFIKVDFVNCAQGGLVSKRVGTSGDTVYTDGLLDNCRVGDMDTIGLRIEGGAGWMIRDLHSYGIGTNVIEFDKAGATTIEGCYFESYGASSDGAVTTANILVVNNLDYKGMVVRGCTGRNGSTFAGREFRIALVRSASSDGDATGSFIFADNTYEMTAGENNVAFSLNTSSASTYLNALIHHNEIGNVLRPTRRSLNGNANGRISFFDNSWQFVSAAPTAKSGIFWYSGDVLYNPDPNATIEKWVCITTSSGGGTHPGIWRAVCRVVKGATAGRPTLGANDAGAIYLDTTLDAAGAPLLWNGAAWLRMTTTAV